MFDNTLPVSMSDGSQLTLDDSVLISGSNVISYNFPDMIDESSGTFTDYTASNLDNGYHTTSSIVSNKSFITSSNYYNINNDLKVSEHAYLFSSGSNDYWSWRKPSEIQVGDYLLGINEEIRQVSSSEQIVNGTIGLSQINVEDVDTLFVNGYLVHNGLEDDPGGGSGATFSIVNQSASIHLNINNSRSPFLNQIEGDSISAYILSQINSGRTNSNPIEDCSSAFRLRGGLSTGGGTGTAQNIKLGMRTTSTSDDFRFIQFTLSSGTNGLGNLSGSGLSNRNISIELSGSFIDDDPSPAVSVPATTIHLITPGEYKGHMQLTASAGTGGTTVSTFGDLKIVNLLTAQRFVKTFDFRDASAVTTLFPTHSGEVRAEQISAKDIRDFATSNENQAKPNFRATDSQTQESALAGSGFSPAGNREQETISIDEIHSSSYA